MFEYSAATVFAMVSLILHIHHNLQLRLPCGVAGGDAVAGVAGDEIESGHFDVADAAYAGVEVGAVDVNGVEHGCSYGMVEVTVGHSY